MADIRRLDTGAARDPTTAAATDGSGELIGAIPDRRIRLIVNGANLGLTRSLNRGLDLIDTEFVARMDADDIAEPNRLERQLTFLRARPDIGLLGTGRAIIDESGAFVADAPAIPDDRSIRRKALLGNPFAHPTMMLRTSVLRDHALRYDESCPTAQDYDLWVRLLAVSRGANLPEPLLRYRLRAGISQTRKAEQLATHDRIAARAIAAFAPGFPATPEIVRQLRGRFGGHSLRDPAMHPDDPRWRRLHADLLAAFDRAHPAP